MKEQSMQNDIPSIDNIFEHYDPFYERIGLDTTPVARGEKKPIGKDWNKRRNLSAEERANLRKRHPRQSIGVLAGTKTTIGNLFGFADIDNPVLAEFAKAAIGLKSAKVGLKGITIFCQFHETLKSKKLRRKGETAPDVEFMIDSGMTVIPPSPHPSGQAYYWVGTPLHDVEPSELPCISLDQMNFINVVCGHTAALQIASEPDIKPHDLMLALTSCGIALLDLDLEWMARCLNALLPVGYKGNTSSETLGMLHSARKKGLGSSDNNASEYNPGTTGPIALGYVADGRFVFFDQGRRLLHLESSTKLGTIGALQNLAPFDFWAKNFSQKGKINVMGASIALMAEARKVGGFDESRVRGRGIYMENGAVINNFEGAVLQSNDYVYIRLVPMRLGDATANVRSRDVLNLFELFNFEARGAPYLLLGWVACAVICGALEWRPHIFLTGAKNTGKTTLVNIVHELLRAIAVALDGQSTEAGIRQKLGPDSRPVILDEFESDQNVGRMKQIVKLIRSASSGDLPIARGTPEGRALEFTIRSTFMLAAINAMSVTAADRSRIVTLGLKKHQNDKDRARQIAISSRALKGLSGAWCAKVIANTSLILRNIETVRIAFPPTDSRHATNMSTLLAAAWTMLHEREIGEGQTKQLLGEHLEFIGELGQAHEADDAVECWDALLQYSIDVRDGGRMLGDLLSEMKQASKTGSRESLNNAAIRRFGINWEDDGIVVANSHRGLNEIYKGTQWEAGTWGSSLKRLPGAKATAQRRFDGDQRSLGTFIPRPHIPDAIPLKTAF